jgi:hypothetical protein
MKSTSDEIKNRYNTLRQTKVYLDLDTINKSIVDHVLYSLEKYKTLGSDVCKAICVDHIFSSKNIETNDENDDFYFSEHKKILNESYIVNASKIKNPLTLNITFYIEDDDINVVPMFKNKNKSIDHDSVVFYQGRILKTIFPELDVMFTNTINNYAMPVEITRRIGQMGPTNGLILYSHIVSFIRDSLRICIGILEFKNN